MRTIEIFEINVQNFKREVEKVMKIKRL